MNTGAFGEGFPYTNFHDLNMDWIIKIAKDFLDQYTHIQEIIEQGKTDITELTESGLQDLQDKKDALEALLQDWYDTHSEDIANQLADALEDLNEWYTLHQNYLDQTLIDKENAFSTYADTKTAQSIASIPDDYSELTRKVISLPVFNVHTNWTGGFIRNTGAIQDLPDNTDLSAGYFYSDFIEVHKGELYLLTAHGSASVLFLAGYEDTLSDPILAESIKGVETTGVATFLYRVNDLIKYVRICSNPVLNRLTFIKLEDAPDMTADKYKFLTERNLCTKGKLCNNLFVNGSTETVSSTYFTIKDIPVVSGIRYYIYSNGRHFSGQTYKDARFITVYDSSNNVLDTLTYQLGYFIPPTNAHHIAISFEYTDGKSDYYNHDRDHGFYYVSQYPVTENIGLVSNYNKLSHLSIRDSEIFYENTRKAVVTFTFDDNPQEDEGIVSIFDKCGATCGFGLITGDILTSPRFIYYRNLYNKGYSILCHSNNGDNMGTETDFTEEQLLVKMRDTKKALEDCGIKVSGWITPQSYMKPAYRDTLSRFYDYAYCTYFGTYNGTGVPYDTLPTRSIDLKRVHFQSTSLANLKQAVDLTIANNGLLTIYAHAYEDNFRTADLEALIDYIKEKEHNKVCHLYSPDEAYIYYYRTRMGDI